MSERDEQSKIVSVRRVLQAKLGPRAKTVPRFVVEWLRHIVHEDEINDFLERTKGITGVEWLKAVVGYLDMRLNIEGAENLPPADEGPYTFVCNHPLGGPDGIAVGAVLGEHYAGKIRYIVNDMLLFLPGLKPLCVPVNKTGGQSHDLPRLIARAFASDDNIIMFPAGLCSRRHSGVIHDLPWKKTFITRSVEAQRDVVPMHFSGRNSDRFYRIARLCELLHSPVNVAMLFLADETYRNVHKEFTLKIGKPIAWQTFDKSKTPAQWAQYVESICYSL